MNKILTLFVLFLLNLILIQNKFLDQSLFAQIEEDLIFTIDNDNETSLKEAMEIVNEKRGLIIINTPLITLRNHKKLQLTGLSNSGILGIKQQNGEYPIIYLDTQIIDNMMPSPKFFSGIELYGANKFLKNIIVENSIGSGIYIKGKNNTLDHIFTRYNRYAGIQIDVEADNNILKNCYSYRNICNAIYANGGFGFHINGAKNILLENCVAFDNARSGFNSIPSSQSNDITFSHCSSWNNGNIDVFTGEFDFNNGKPLDKRLWTIKRIIENNEEFEKNYQNKIFNFTSEFEKKFFSDTELQSSKIGFEIEETDKSKITIDYCVSFDNKIGIFMKTCLNCNLSISNLASFNNFQNYENPNSILEEWVNNWVWNGRVYDTIYSGYDLKYPRDTQNINKLFYQIRDRIVDSLFENKIPDSVTFDIGIRGLKNNN